MTIVIIELYRAFVPWIDHKAVWNGISLNAGSIIYYNKVTIFLITILKFFLAYFFLLKHIFKVFSLHFAPPNCARIIADDTLKWQLMGKVIYPSCWRLLVSIPDALELAWTHLALLRNDEGRKKTRWVDQCVYDTWQEERVGALLPLKSLQTFVTDANGVVLFIYLWYWAQRGRWWNLVQFCTRLYFSSNGPVHWNL